MAVVCGPVLSSLVSGAKSEVQFQPAGIDLTLSEVHEFLDSGVVDFDNSRRRLSKTAKLEFSADGSLHLKKGAYKIIYNEIVKIPANAIALGFPRSSLLRCGASIECAVWDPGYEGRSESLLVVHNPEGLTLCKDARVLQLVFVRTEGATEKQYDGIYKGENMKI